MLFRAQWLIEEDYEDEQTKSSKGIICVCKKVSFKLNLLTSVDESNQGGLMTALANCDELEVFD